MSEAPDMNRTIALVAVWQGGQFIVQERTHEPGRGVGFWGGKLRVKEDPFDAAARELHEETGLELASMSPSELGELDVEGWRVHAYQGLLSYMAQVTAKEGNAFPIGPVELSQHPRLMAATGAVLRKLILEPNGIVDN